MSRTKKKSHARPEDQIKARVAPAPRPKNVIKKVYKEGSPGANRKAAGLTLTALKKSMNEPGFKAVVMLDKHGQPTGEETVEAFRDTVACTKRRRSYTGRYLLGRTKGVRRLELRGLARDRKARRKSGKVAAKTNVAVIAAAKKGRK